MVRRFVRHHATSTGVARIVTDAGSAYLKAMGNPEGAHALASEWVGTQLARLFGLQTFDVALIVIDADADAIPLPTGGYVQSGPAFCARAEIGRHWDGSTHDLNNLDNLQDITRLDVDTPRRDALTELICRRAQYVADHFLRVLERDYISLL